MEEFKNRVKQLRIEKKLTQQELAEMVGVLKGSVSKWECGITRPEFETLDKLCDIFNVSLSYLLGSSDVKERREMTEEDKDRLGFESYLEDECESIELIVKDLVRLSSRSKDVVRQTVKALLKNDLECERADPEGYFDVDIKINFDDVK